MQNQEDLYKTITKVLSTRPPELIRDKTASSIHAAVLIPLFRDDGKYKVLFTERTDRVEHHKGQISFPGGAKDEDDGSFQETALREVYEEIGILKEDIEILGRIDDTTTVTSNFIIHPFVGVIPYPYDFKLNSREVKRLIVAPLNFFFADGALDKGHTIEIEGATYRTPAYIYDGDLIWGATARIMENFINILEEKLILPRIPE